MTSPPVKQIDTTVTKETKQMPAVNDSTHEKSIDTKVEEENDSNSGWGCIDDNDDKKEEKIENTNWDTKATVWNTEEKKVNDTCTTNSQAQEEDKESGWGAVDDVNEKKGNWDAKDDNKDNAEDNGRWNSFGSSKPARQFSQRSDQGWGRGGNDHSRGYQSGSERGSQRFGRNDQERSNLDSFDRNRRGGRDSYQRRDDNGTNDGYGRGGFRSNDGYKRDNYGSNDSFRRGGQRGDDNYRQDNYGLNDYNQRGHDDMQSSRGGYYDQQRGFEPRNKQYNQRENDSMNNSSMYPRNDFGQQDGFTKRKTYYDQDKRPRQEFYNESYGNQSPSYQSGYNPPRRDFPDNEATRRFKRPRPINPPPSKVIGIFGMPISSAEPDIEKFILDNCPNAKFNDIRLVKNHATGLSKGFCFVYFNSIDESIEAKESLTGKILQGSEVRVDFSTSPEPRMRYSREE